MSAGLIDKPITWGSLARVGLAWAAEYGVLSLIEDAPFAVKMATIVCALGALAALETKEWLNQRKYLFFSVMGFVSAIYFCFVIYAASHALHLIFARNGLEQKYAQSNELLRREVLETNPQHGADKENEAARQFARDVSEWKTSTGDWIRENVGVAAYARFLEPPTMFYNFGPHFNKDYNMSMNDLVGCRRNLAIIIETGAYADK